jgi:hypothetical protein
VQSPSPGTTRSIVETEDDPTPIVLILAATLRRAEETPKLAAMMRGARGTVALRSTVDPQAATIRFGGGRVRVERGVAADADVTIATDVNRMADEDPPRPKVSGAATHARLALLASKVLEPPTGPWRDEARRFWARIESHPRTPRGMHVVCTDERSQITLGAEPVEFEIHGTAHRLHALFTGGTVLGQEVLDGHLYAVGSLEHLAELTGRSIDVSLGRR